MVVLKRGGGAVPMKHGRDILWEEFLSKGTGQSGAHVEMESNEPAFILATSGTTARPKLAVHTHGGYQVHIVCMAKWCFGLEPEDVWWSTSDIGWVVGHSYIVYAPLIIGATTLVYEGSIDHPAPDAVWRIVEEFGVTGIFTSPTAVRLLMRYGEEHARGHDLSTLTRVLSAGEVLNAPAWEWLQRTVFADRIPVIDHMWQTETGGPIFGNPFGLGLLPIKPGSSGIPLPGVEPAVVTAEGEPCRPGEKGIMVLKRPSGLTPTPGRARAVRARLLGTLPGGHTETAHVDEDGYVWFAGRRTRSHIAGHRIGTIEVETACFGATPAVAEAGSPAVRTSSERSPAFVVPGWRPFGVGGVENGGHRDHSPRARPGRRHRRAQLRQHASQDTERKDHAPRPEGGDPRQGTGRHHDHRG